MLHRSIAKLPEVQRRRLLLYFFGEMTYEQIAALELSLIHIYGYDLIDYINQFQIPVIFVTAKTSVNDRVKGVRLGAEDYISKPFDLEELLARVETCLLYTSLCLSGIVSQVYKVEQIKKPLENYRDIDAFKIYVSPPPSCCRCPSSSCGSISGGRTPPFIPSFPFISCGYS